MGNSFNKTSHAISSPKDETNIFSECDTVILSSYYEKVCSYGAHDRPRNKNHNVSKTGVISMRDSVPQSRDPEPKTGTNNMPTTS